MIEGKVCPECKVYKLTNSFNKNRSRADGLLFWCKTCLAKCRTKYTAETHRNNILKYRYGMGLAEYDQMLLRQDGVCAICESTCSRHAHLSVDHCHTTGKVRGLLCHRCNISLYDNVTILRKMIKYLENREGLK